MNSNYDYIIISGIEAGDGGTGKLIEYLEKNHKGNYILLSIAEPNREAMIKKIRQFSGEKLLLIHPQSIGFELFVEIVRKNKIYWYVMDNSFFCVKSYNHLSFQFKPCFECITDGHDAALQHACTPFPVKMDLKENIKYLEYIYNLKDQIVFLAQNQMQKKLLDWYFKSSDVRVIGLKTSDLFDDNTLFVPNEKRTFDIVFHANPLEAKGLLFCLEVSQYLSEYTFLIPSDFRECQINLGKRLNKDSFSNVTFSKMRWQNGLEYFVKKAKTVLVPSLWSAPVEGALLKSILHNGRVAVCSIDFSFAEEIPKDALIKLDPYSMEKSAIILKNILEDSNGQKRLIMKSQKWLHEYLRKDLIYTMDMEILKDADKNVKYSEEGESIKKELIALCDENKKYRSTYKCYNKNFTKEFIDLLKSVNRIKVGIFGAGSQGENVYHFIQEWNQVQYTEIEVMYFFDNNESKWNTAFLDKKILKPTNDNFRAVDIIIIASMWKSDIIVQLTKMGFTNIIVSY